MPFGLIILCSNATFVGASIAGGGFGCGCGCPNCPDGRRPMSSWDRRDLTPHHTWTYKPAHMRLWNLGGDWGVYWGTCKEGPNSEHNGHSQKKRLALRPDGLNNTFEHGYRLVLRLLARMCPPAVCLRFVLKVSHVRREPTVVLRFNIALASGFLFLSLQNVRVLILLA